MGTIHPKCPCLNCPYAVLHKNGSLHDKGPDLSCTIRFGTFTFDPEAGDPRKNIPFDHPSRVGPGKTPFPETRTTAL
jgi:hypothetical protein